MKKIEWSDGVTKEDHTIKDVFPKFKVVAAEFEKIREVVNDNGTETGNSADLTTADKSSVVAGVNENQQKIANEVVKKADITNTVTKNDTKVTNGGAVSTHTLPYMLACNFDAININGSGSSWNLVIAAANLTAFYNGVSVSNIAVNKAIAESWTTFIFDRTNSDVLLVTDDNSATTLLHEKSRYLLIGRVFPKFGQFDMKCNYSVNGVRNQFDHGTDIASISNSTAVSFLYDTSWTFTTVDSGVRLYLNGVEKTTNASSIGISNISYTWFFASITTGNIQATTNLNAVESLFDDNLEHVFLGRANPQFNLFEMNCNFNVNGVNNILNETIVVDPFAIDLIVDTPLVSNTLTFIDEQETPLYKKSMFKLLDSDNKYNVVLETTLPTGFKRTEIHNPTQLKASDIGTDTRIVFECDIESRKLVYKDITKIYKAVTTGKSGSLNLLMIADSIGQGNAGLPSMPLSMLKDYLLTLGVTVNGIGTYAMDIGASTGTAPSSAYMGEGRGYWNYKTFVGKDNSPYGTPVSINLSDPYTLKFENPFLRLATATDKTNNPTWCFTNKTENAVDTDGVSYATDPSQPSGNYYIFDAANYLSAHSVTTPDVITIALATNDWQESGEINIDDEFLSFQIMYNQWRTALPTTPILIVPTQSLFPEDQPEWENEMFELAERIISYIEITQSTDTNLHQLPVFQNQSRFHTFKTLGVSSDISATNNIQIANANDVHFLDKESARKSYIEVFESVILSLI